MSGIGILVLFFGISILRNVDVCRLIVCFIRYLRFCRLLIYLLMEIIFYVRVKVIIFDVVDREIV